MLFLDSDLLLLKKKERLFMAGCTGGVAMKYLCYVDLPSLSVLLVFGLLKISKSIFGGSKLSLAFGKFCGSLQNNIWQELS